MGNLVTYCYDSNGVVLSIVEKGVKRDLTPEELERNRIEASKPKSKGLSGRDVTPEELAAFEKAAKEREADEENMIISTLEDIKQLLNKGETDTEASEIGDPNSSEHSEGDNPHIKGSEDSL
jgi:hypothetical protein